MATEKQIEANTRNASRSTGPKSAEGKARVARNALKHGLAGHGVIFPEEMAGQIQDRREFFWKAFKPDGPLQQWMFDRICIESVRADSCLHQLIALRDEASRRAGESWNDDRALEAEQRGARLSGTPELVQPKLRQLKHGTRWLLAQWEELERLWDVRGAWTEAASSRAMDLLGLAADGREGAWTALTGEGANGDGLRSLIRDEVAALRHRLEDYLEDRDDRARSDAQAGIGEQGADVRRVMRYEGEVLRRLRAWIRELRRLQGDASKGSDRLPGPPAFDAAGSIPDRSAPPPGSAPATASARPEVVATTPSTSRGSLGFSGRTLPSDLSPPSNRHARRAQAAFERRNRRA